MFIESISPEDLGKLEYASFPGKIHVIDSVGAEFNRAIAYLRSQKVIGFDTETRPCFGPNQPRYGVSLLQLSGPEKAYLFRVKNMGMHRRLCNILADKRIVKVGAAIHDDILGLQRKHDFTPAQFVDLQNDPGIIAYGKLESDEAVADYREFYIPLEYRDKTRTPKYIVISCCASYLGDYFTGGEGSKLLVDEFELVYDEPLPEDESAPAE